MDNSALSERRAVEFDGTLRNVDIFTSANMSSMSGAVSTVTMTALRTLIPDRLAAEHVKAKSGK